MTITVIGKVSTWITFEEWEKKLQNEIDASAISRINITGGNEDLNRYVRKFAHQRNLILNEFTPDFETYGSIAKLNRNRALIDNCDLVVAFIPSTNSIKSTLASDGQLGAKKGLVIKC